MSIFKDPGIYKEQGIYKTGAASGGGGGGIFKLYSHDLVIDTKNNCIYYDTAPTQQSNIYCSITIDTNDEIEIRVHFELPNLNSLFYVFGRGMNDSYWYRFFSLGYDGANKKIEFHYPVDSSSAWSSSPFINFELFNKENVFLLKKEKNSQQVKVYVNGIEVLDYIMQNAWYGNTSCFIGGLYNNNNNLLYKYGKIYLDSYLKINGNLVIPTTT